jgi:hypothetical protein
MAQPNRKIVITETVGDVTPYDIDGSLEQLEKQVQELIAKHGKDARLSWDSNFYYPYESNPSPRFHIRVDREESDKEYTDRVARSKADNAAREIREKAEFERLAKKYGKS